MNRDLSGRLRLCDRFYVVCAGAYKGIVLYLGRPIYDYTMTSLMSRPRMPGIADV